MTENAGFRERPRTGRSAGRHRRVDRDTTKATGRKFVTESLFRNSGFLLVNIIIGTVCSYGALSLLTRLYSVSAVGISATAASVSALIVFVTQFGVATTLPRFLPTSRNRSALINSALSFILLITLLASAGFFLLPYAQHFALLGGLPFVLFFVLGGCAQAGQAVLDTVLISDRQSGKMAKANIIPNLFGLAVPAPLRFLGPFGAFASRLASNIAAFVVLAVAVARGGHRFRFSLSRTAISGLGRFSAGVYVASLLGSLPLMLLPPIILSRFGAEQSAYWAIAIAIATFFFQLPGSVSQALLPEVSHRPRERRSLIRRSAALVVVVVVPVLTIAYVAAPLPLAILGPSYAAALSPLRWLIIAGYITILNYASGTVLLLAKKTFLISLVNVVNAVIVLGMTLTWARNANDVAISWAIGDVANTVLFGLFALLAVYQVRGRWEMLGSPRYPTSAPQGSTQSRVEAQQQGLEMLRMLAQVQRSAAQQQSLKMFPTLAQMQRSEPKSPYPKDSG
jgi:O-antigen/teichoic acid export membrane protein